MPLETPMLLLSLALSFLVGGSLGLLGGGGSILTVPILLYVVGLEPRSAIATSLVVVGATSLAAMFAHARGGRVRWKTGFVFGLTSMASAFVAGKLSRGVPGLVLVLGFGVMMLVTGVAMMRGRRAPEAGGTRWGRSIAQGLGVGAITGFVGAGGGFVVVPALVLLGGLSIPEAVGTSLLVISMNSTAALAGQLGSAQVPWSLAAAFAGVAIAGSFAGAAAAGRVRPDLLRRGFAWFVIVMAVFLLAQEGPRSLGWNPTLASHWPWILGGTFVPLLIGAMDLHRLGRPLKHHETHSETTKQAAHEEEGRVLGRSSGEKAAR